MSSCITMFYSKYGTVTPFLNFISHFQVNYGEFCVSITTIYSTGKGNSIQSCTPLFWKYLQIMIRTHQIIVQMHSAQTIRLTLHEHVANQPLKPRYNTNQWSRDAVPASASGVNRHH